VSPVRQPVQKKKVVYIERTRTEPRLGGEGSGMAPPYLIGAGLQSHLLLGLDVGNNFSRVAAMVDGEVCLLFDSFLSIMEAPRDERSFSSFSATSGEVEFARSIRSKLGSDWVCEVGGVNYDAAQLYSSVLRFIKTGVEERLEKLVSGAVLTVPCTFSAAQRNLILQAAADAGLNVIQLINEPSAAALQYCTLNPQMEGRYLVVSMGAGAFGVTALEFYHGILEIKYSCGNSAIGGDNLDDRLVQWMIDKIEADNKIQVLLDGATRERLRRAAEQVRRDLEIAEVAHVHMPSFAAAGSGYLNLASARRYNLVASITRAEFLELVKPISLDIDTAVGKVLAEAGFEVGDLKAVLYQGGVAETSYVRNLVTAHTGNVAIRFLDRDRSAVYGAAVQANLLSYGVRDYVLWDVLNTDICVQTEGTAGAVVQSVVSAGTPLPVKAYGQLPVQNLTACARVFQTSSSLSEYQAPVAGQSDVTLAEVVVNNCPPPKEGKTVVELGIIVSADGRVDYTARHMELMSPLPLSVREGERAPYRNVLDELMDYRCQRSPGSAARVARLARKMNIVAELVPKTLRELGYLPDDIASGVAVEHMLKRLKRSKSSNRGVHIDDGDGPATCTG